MWMHLMILIFQTTYVYSSSLRLIDLGRNFVTIRFPDSRGGRLSYVEESLFQSSTDPPWETAIVLNGNNQFTITGLQPETEYRLVWNSGEQIFRDVRVVTKVKNKSFKAGNKSFSNNHEKTKSVKFLLADEIKESTVEKQQLFDEEYAKTAGYHTKQPPKPSVIGDFVKPLNETQEIKKDNVSLQCKGLFKTCRNNLENRRYQKLRNKANETVDRFLRRKSNYKDDERVKNSKRNSKVNNYERNKIDNELNKSYSKTQTNSNDQIKVLTKNKYEINTEEYKNTITNEYVPKQEDDVLLNVSNISSTSIHVSKQLKRNLEIFKKINSGSEGNGAVRTLSYQDRNADDNALAKSEIHVNSSDSRDYSVETKSSLDPTLDLTLKEHQSVTNIEDQADRSRSEVSMTSDTISISASSLDYVHRTTREAKITKKVISEIKEENKFKNVSNYTIQSRGNSNRIFMSSKDERDFAPNDIQLNETNKFKAISTLQNSTPNPSGFTKSMTKIENKRPDQHYEMKLNMSSSQTAEMNSEDSNMNKELNTEIVHNQNLSFRDVANNSGEKRILAANIVETTPVRALTAESLVLNNFAYKIRENKNMRGIFRNIFKNNTSTNSLRAEYQIAGKKEDDGQKFIYVTVMFLSASLLLVLIIIIIILTYFSKIYKENKKDMYVVSV